jgi:hypothetical protein
VSRKAAKRTKAAKELPLVSPHWWPREKTVAFYRTHKGEIADVALTVAVNAGELPVKFEWIDHQTSPPTQHRMLLSAKDYEFGLISNNFLVIQPRRPDVPPLSRPHALFFWGPKVKEFCPAEEAEPPPNPRRRRNVSAQPSVENKPQRTESRTRVLIRKIADELWKGRWENITTGQIRKDVGGVLKKRGIAVPERDTFLRALGRRKDKAQLRK